MEVDLVKMWHLLLAFPVLFIVCNAFYFIAAMAWVELVFATAVDLEAFK